MANSPWRPYSGLDSTESETSMDILTCSPDTVGRKKRKGEGEEHDLGHITKRLASERKMSLSDRIEIRIPDLVYPKSKYSPATPPLPVVSERFAIEELHNAWVAASRQTKRSRKEAATFESFTLTCFTIYRPDVGWHSGEMAPLQDLKSRRGAGNFLFDGLLTVGSVRHWVQKVPFNILAVDGYAEPTIHQVSDKIYIQSEGGNARKIWYRLEEPAPEYKRFYQPFLWLATFTKYAVDYLTESPSVTLRHFQADFHEWCHTRHGHNGRFRAWFKEFGRTDLRQVVAANVDYLWKEATDIDNTTRRHPFWKEVDGDQLGAIEAQSVVEKNTIVTPFVYNCFRKMYFKECLESRTPVSKIDTAWQGRKESLGLFPGIIATINANHPAPQMLPPGHKQTFAVGDIIGVKRDADSAWKDKADIWYAYVQNLDQDYKGRQLLDVLWLYAPADTTCSSAYYPFKNELFMSDNCNCHDGKLFASDVACRASVQFWPQSPSNPDTLFIRQKYRTEDASFMHLKQSDFKCAHISPSWKSDLEEVMENHQIGDTVLVESEEDDALLEPMEIVDFKLELEQVLVRQLLRRHRDLNDSTARPNELVYTNTIYSIPASKVVRRCHVRFFSAADVRRGQIPVPYDRNGNGDCWFISTRLIKGVNDTRLEELQSANYPATLIQGVDPTAAAQCKPLNGMDLYCGGGTFGRGLEESGAIKNLWSVDWAKKPLHTYRANQQNQEESALFHGSVNDYLAQAMGGESSRLIAPIGEAQHLSAGSPCQGFSVAQPNKLSEQSKKNASMVASVAAFIDFYGFEYAILENVVTMASNVGENKDQNVLAQLICTLVAMGYQLQLFNLDAWSFGAPQSRSRLFVSIAAPGFALPPHPKLTHSHPPGKWNRSLGKAVNGEPFGKRRFEKTPFKFVSAQEGVADLPFIGDAAVPISTRFPNHRPAVDYRQSKRNLISAIPRWPRGQGFASALHNGSLPRGLIEIYSRKSEAAYARTSHAWKRIRPGGLFPTITTKQTAACTLTGTLLHWDEHRIITILEARRAQGFPDEEVLIGLPADQYHVIGNSVARQVALALGMSLREAWLQNSENESSALVETSGVTADEDIASATSLSDAMELTKTEDMIRIDYSVEPLQPLVHKPITANNVIPTGRRNTTFLSASETVRIVEGKRSLKRDRTTITLSRTINITTETSSSSTLVTPRNKTTGPLYAESKSSVSYDSDMDTGTRDDCEAVQEPSQNAFMSSHQ